MEPVAQAAKTVQQVQQVQQQVVAVALHRQP
jgi:hypothetical protein